MIFSAGDDPIFETHRLHEKDQSPLQLVSAEQLAYYRRIEADYFTIASIISASPASANTEVVSAPK